ncbi:MAG: transposase [Sphingobacteriales bacterium]|jgi:hypothetical protein|nr:transposase [Sphingobacteriales bacterium]MBP9142110.1 transposase [Chitinophagales bacterium]MDA0199305.1 transposase [Bacteroidota bacterium]MBK6889654.1 transposase [Sphingobacteriales bacterium]MBK7527833.1 transposase [Sphingobacteriales bacterium]
MRWGFKMVGFALGDVENHTALHYQAVQTQYIKGADGDSLRQYYAGIIVNHAKELLKISKYMVFDAYFSKKSFVDGLVGQGFTMISRLQSNCYLRYAYKGAQKGGRGRPKAFDGKIDLKNISTQHFTIIPSKETEIIYQDIAHVRTLIRWCKLVIVQKLQAEGKVKSTCAYFCTDPQTDGQKILQYYQLRFQIEFLFRDAKQHLGLQDCQARSKEALDFHFRNA